MVPRSPLDKVYCISRNHRNPLQTTLVGLKYNREKFWGGDFLTVLQIKSGWSWIWNSEKPFISQILCFLLLLPSLTSVPPLKPSSNITSFGLLLSVSAYSTFSSYQFGILSSIGVTICMSACPTWQWTVHLLYMSLVPGWVFSIEGGLSKCLLTEWTSLPHPTCYKCGCEPTQPIANTNILKL